VNRIGEILRLKGDLDSADVRRSKAIGILAQPAHALQLLWEFRNQQHPAAEPQQPHEPIHNEYKPPYDQSIAPSPSPEDPPETALESGLVTGPVVEAEPVQESGSVQAAVGCGLIIQPSGVDVGKLRPQVMLHIHLSHEALLGYTKSKPGLTGGVGRFEGVGPITLGQVRRFLSHTACDIAVQPIIDPQNTPAVDSYEIPRRIREAMFLRMPASCFPYAPSTQRIDLDHTKAYLPPAQGGLPGQTGVHNLGPMSRFEHRIKTHSRWQVRQPEPGVWLWQSPHHNYYLVTNTGTHNLSNGPFARRIWKAAQPRAVTSSKLDSPPIYLSP
jgi:hypothetical protein